MATSTAASGIIVDGGIDIKDHNLDLTNDKIFDIFAEMARPSIYNMILPISRRGAVAEEITQNALLKAWLNRSEFRHDSSPLTWVSRIAFNEAIQQLRRDGARTTSHEIPLDDRHEQLTISEPEQYENIHKREQAASLRKAIASIRPKEKQVMLLMLDHQLSGKQIAERTGLTENGVKTRLRRGRSQIRYKLLKASL